MKKRSPPLSLEERKERNNAMWCFLEALPPARHSPSYQYHALEKTIQRLKAFLRFLTALNPKQYLAWMLKAFSYTTTSTTLSIPTEPYGVKAAPFSFSEERDPSLPDTQSKEKKQGRKQVITPG